MIHQVTIRDLLQMTGGLTEYDDSFVRTYQNTHRDEDLTPFWILNTTNRSFVYPPGKGGRYSSTNFVILGLVLANLHNVCVFFRRILPAVAVEFDIEPN
jgi:CubicO group peptidase (beta-lactamase class C family)